MTDIVPFRVDREMIGYDPFDALWRINPEIASIACANRDGILKTEIMPYVARFRELQTVEKLGVLDFLTENNRIGADERMNRVINQTHENIATIREGGAVERTRIRGETAIETTRLKYDAKVRIVNAQVEGQKYISDNELAATYIEAEALRDIIITSEKVRAVARMKESDDKRRGIEKVAEYDFMARSKEADAEVEGEAIRAVARMKESDDRLRGVVRKAELNYMARIKEAEVLRANEDEKSAQAVIVAYLSAQEQLMRYFFDYQMQRAKLKTARLKDAYEGLANLVKPSFELLAKKDAKRLTIDALTLSGPIKLDIKLE